MRKNIDNELLKKYNDDPDYPFRLTEEEAINLSNNVNWDHKKWTKDDILHYIKKRKKRTNI